MNRTQIEGRWQTITGQIKSRFGKLTRSDAQNLAGKRDQLLGKLRERYGVVKDDAEKQIDKLISLVKPRPSEPPVAPKTSAPPQA